MAVSLLERGAEGYEGARRDAVWNELEPERYPRAIVLAKSADDVVEAVRYAREHGLKVKARSGGHSWTASSLRHDGLLIDLSRMTGISFDPATGVAVVEPGVRGRELNGLLADHGLFFPSGHCPTVGLGGFLLQGGWGWLSRVIGPACLSLIAFRGDIAECCGCGAEGRAQMRDGRVEIVFAPGRRRARGVST